MLSCSTLRGFPLLEGRHMTDRDNSTILSEELEQTLQTIDSIRFVGNIIPYAWHDHIKTPEGRTHLVAIHLLSEIVYWYQPNRLYDEDTGEFIGFEKRFKGQQFCRFAEAFEQQFGLTAEAVKEALDLLVSLNLITYWLARGRTNDYVSDRLYAIGIHAEEIARISQLTVGELV